MVHADRDVLGWLCCHEGKDAYFAIGLDLGEDVLPVVRVRLRTVVVSTTLARSRSLRTYLLTDFSSS